MLSILRRAQYRFLGSVTMQGKVLDLGGSTRSGYHELIAGSPAFTVVNIDASYGCDLVFDVQQRFPLDDASFDHALSLNVMEHLSDPWAAIAEASRVLKPGGTFVGATPFMHHIHASPDDYYRYTASALEKGFRDHGFEKVRIVPLGDGIMSLLFQTAGGFFPRPLYMPFQHVAVGIDRVLCWSASYRRLRDRIPLGYGFVFRKA